MIPDITVVVPVYNVEKYLQACIDSLINQTMQNIEYIFVDDASTDNSLQILKDNADRYPDKMTVIASPKNRCQGGARNLGIKAARGKYIGFVDSDDMVLPDMYANLYRPIREGKNDLDAIFCQCTVVPEKFAIAEYTGGGTPYVKWHEKLLKLNDKKLSVSDKQDLMAYPIGGVYSGIYRREMIVGNNLFFPEHLRYEDNYWGTFLKVTLNKVYFVQSIGYLYRQRETSTVHARNQKFQYDRITIEKMQVNDAKRRGIYQDYKEALDYMYIFRCCFNTFGMFLEVFDPVPKEVLVELMKELKETLPGWRNNQYYKELTGFKGKLRNNIWYAFPSKAVNYHPLYKKMKFKLKSWRN